jgi:hypothetical protein
MKTIQRQQTNELPKAEFTEKDLSALFAEDYEPFAEKNARAKEHLSKVKFPEGFFDRK